MRTAYYTVYLNETDEVVAFGSAEECRRRLGLKSLESFYSLISKNRKGKQNRYTVITENIRGERID